MAKQRKQESARVRETAPEPALADEPKTDEPKTEPAREVRAGGHVLRDGRWVIEGKG